MKAAVLLGAGSFEIAEVSPPAPKSGEVLIRVSGCGICGSNLPPWLGEVSISYPQPPGAPGHEVYGTVAACGGGVLGVRVGARVSALTERSFAELDVASASTVVPIPESLADEPVLGEPLACAVNVISRSGIREGDTVVVVGIGFLGGLILQLARERRPGRLIAVSRRAASRELAHQLGADHVLSYDQDVEGKLASWTNQRLADVVIEVTGYSSPLDLAARLTRVRGRLVIAGYHQSGERRVDLRLWNWRGLDVINAHERAPEVYRRGIEEGVRLLEAGRLSLEPLLTHFFPLAEINRAFATAVKRPEDFVKAVVVSHES